MSLKRMDNVLIVVDDLDAVKAFFIDLGLELEGETTVEGPSVDRLIGLENVRATLAVMRTPDGQGRIELDKFHTPEAIRTSPPNAPVNAYGIRRIMFTVDDIEEVVRRLLAQGAELVGEVVQYEDTYRLAYVRGPGGPHHRACRGARIKRFPPGHARAGLAASRCAPLSLRHDPAPSLFPQRDPGRVLRPSGDSGGEELHRHAAFDPSPGRCTPVRPGDVAERVELGSGAVAIGMCRQGR